MLKPRHIAATAAVLAAALPAIGIDRIVEPDGHLTAVSAQPSTDDRAAPIAFKSDYFPLER